MGYYSDPTANMAIGNINKEISKLEKKAKSLKKLLEKGKLSQKELERAQAQFTGLYRHVLDNVLEQESE